MSNVINPLSTMGYKPAGKITVKIQYKAGKAGIEDIELPYTAGVARLLTIDDNLVGFTLHTSNGATFVYGRSSWAWLLKKIKLPNLPEIDIEKINDISIML